MLNVLKLILRKLEEHQNMSLLNDIQNNLVI